MTREEIISEINKEFGLAGDSKINRLLQVLISESDVINEVSRTITSAEIQNGHSQYIEIVPAPGANKVIFPTEVFLIYKFNTAAYNVVDGELYHDDGSYLAPLASVDLDAVSDNYTFQVPGIIGNNPFLNKTDFTNKPIVFLVTGAGAGGVGDSTVHVKIKYTIIDVSDLP